MKSSIFNLRKPIAFFTVFLSCSTSGFTTSVRAEMIHLVILDESKKDYYQISINNSERVSSLFLSLQELHWIGPEIDSWAMAKQVVDSRIEVLLDPAKTLLEEEIGSGSTIKLSYGEAYAERFKAKMAEAWSELEEEYGIKKSNSVLIGSSDREFHPIVRARLESWMQIALRNPSKGRAIYRAFCKNIVPYFRKGRFGVAPGVDVMRSQGSTPREVDAPVLYRAVERWLMENIYSITSKLVDPYPKFKETFPYPVEEEFLERVQKFFQEVASIEPVYRVPRSAIPSRVLILTSSSYGGGHFTVASGIGATLAQLYPGVEVKIIDTRKITQQTDSLMLLSGGRMHGEEVYDKIYQQRHDPMGASAYWQILGEVSDYIPDRLVELVEAEIREFKPDLLLSCLHHFPEFIQLAYSFDLPLAIVSTDFVLQSGLPRLIPTLDSRLVKILTTSTHPIFFSQLQKVGHYWGGHFPNAVSRSLDRFIWSPGQREIHEPSQMGWSDFSESMPVFRYLGFPLREGISPNRDPAFLAQARGRLGIRADEKVITLAMGAQGGGNLLKLVNEVVAQAPSDLDLVVLVLCGKNAALLAELKQLSPSRSRLRVQPLGMQTASQMNEIYNLTDVLISKPGGATTAEAAHLQVPFISAEYHPWEKGNGKYLEEIGLGDDIHNNFAKLPKFLQKKLSLTRSVTDQSEQDSFRDRLAAIIKQMLEDRIRLID